MGVTFREAHLLVGQITAVLPMKHVKLLEKQDLDIAERLGFPVAPTLELGTVARPELNS